MATSLSRLLSSATIKISTANPALHSTRFEPVTRPRPVSNSAMRVLCCSTQQAQSHPVKEQSEIPEKTAQDENKQSQEVEDDEEDGVDVNKETGEIGGPKGPEPTRYGDWERNGRCYDF